MELELHFCKDFCIAWEVFDTSSIAVVVCKNLLGRSNRCFVAELLLVVLQMIAQNLDTMVLMVQILVVDMFEVVLVHNLHNYHHSVEYTVECR